jgi:hypothetical protein
MNVIKPMITDGPTTNQRTVSRTDIPGPVSVPASGMLSAKTIDGVKAKKAVTTIVFSFSIMA